MIDTLTWKTKELIIMESDPGMMSWLQEWKRQILNMVAENRFELWEDENEDYADRQNINRPSQGILHLPDKTTVRNGECTATCSESTTSTCIGNNESRTPVVFNLPQSIPRTSNDPFHMSGFIETEAQNLHFRIL
jgi:hypothetical protein